MEPIHAFGVASSTVPSELVFMSLTTQRVHSKITTFLIIHNRASQSGPGVIRYCGVTESTIVKWPVSLFTVMERGLWKTTRSLPTRSQEFRSLNAGPRYVAGTAFMTTRKTV